MENRKELKEKNMIESELSKFRQQLRNRPRSKNGTKKSTLFINMPMNLDINYDEEVKNNSPAEDMNGQSYFDRFYSELVERSPSDKTRLTTTPQDSNYEESESTESSPYKENRLVHFGKNVQVITYERESSETSFSSLSTGSDLYLEMDDSDSDGAFGFRNLNIENFEPELKNFTRTVATRYEEANGGVHYSESTIEMSDNFLKITKYENCRKCEEINYFGEHIFDQDRDRFVEIIEMEPPAPPIPSREESSQSMDDNLMMIKRVPLESKDYSNLIVKNGYKFEEKDKIIEDLFSSVEPVEKPKPDADILRECLLQWHQKTRISKISRENTISKKDRIKKIHEFLNKINIEKRQFFNEAVRKAMAGQKQLDSVTLKKNYEHK